MKDTYSSQYLSFLQDKVLYGFKTPNRSLKKEYEGEGILRAVTINDAQGQDIYLEVEKKFYEEISQFPFLLKFNSATIVAAKKTSQKAARLAQEKELSIEQEITALLEQLKSEDPSVRESAKIHLLKMGAAANLPLIEALEKAYSVLHPMQVENSKEEENISTWLKNLKSANGSERRSIIRRLGELGEYATDEVITALIEVFLTDNFSSVRQAAIANLGKIGPKAVSATEPILNSLSSNREWKLQESALRALAKIGPRAEHIPIFYNRLKDNYPKSSEAGAVLAEIQLTPKEAAFALDWLLSKAQKLDETIGVHAYAIRSGFQKNIVGALNQSAIVPLAQTLRNPDSSNKHIFAAETLGELFIRFYETPLDPFAFATLFDFPSSKIKFDDALLEKAVSQKNAEGLAIWISQEQRKPLTNEEIITILRKKGFSLLPITALQTIASLDPQPYKFTRAISDSLLEEINGKIRLSPTKKQEIGSRLSPNLERFFTFLSKELLKEGEEDKIAVGLKLYSLKRGENIVIVKGLEEGYLIEINLKKGIRKYQKEDSYRKQEDLEDITESYLATVRLNSLPVSPLKDPILKVILLDDLLSSYTQKGRKHALENFLLQWDSQITNETFILKTKHQEELLKLIDQLRLKNRQSFLTHIPEDLKTLDKIYLGTQDSIKALKDKNIKAISVKRSKYPVIAVSFLNSLMNTVALEDYQNAHNLFKTNTEHKGITLTQFKRLIHADPQMLDRYPIEPLLARSLQEAIKLYQLTRNTRISA